MSSLAAPALPTFQRNLVIAGGVVLLHVAALWALQNGLLRRTVEVIVPVQILSEIIPDAPRPPQVQPPPPAPQPVRQPASPKPAPRRVIPKAAPPAPPAPQPVAVAQAPATPAAPIGQIAPQAPAAPPAPPAAAPAAPPAPPAPARVELPSTDADYLQNPKPVYPPVSKRLGEQGKVVVRVLIGADGLPQKAELRQGSGFDRLDQAALATVLKWRYVPGKRGGVPEAMWFNVPINFVLE